MHHYGTAPTERLGRETRTFPVGARSSRQETCGQCLVATLIDNTLVSLQCVISATSIGNQPIRPSVVVWDLETVPQISEIGPSGFPSCTAPEASPPEAIAAGAP